jgi:hypothetical protein
MLVARFLHDGEIKARQDREQSEGRWSIEGTRIEGSWPNGVLDQMATLAPVFFARASPTYPKNSWKIPQHSGTQLLRIRKNCVYCFPSTQQQENDDEAIEGSVQDV